MSEKFKNSRKNEVKSNWNIGDRKGTDPYNPNKGKKKKKKESFRQKIFKR